MFSRKSRSNARSVLSRSGRGLGEFERLEGRRLLAAFTWDGGGDATSWHDGNNWSAAGADNNTVPNADDACTINIAGAPVITFSAASGTRTIASLVSNEILNFTGGSLTISGASDFNASTTLSGGTLALNGASTFDGGLTISGTATLTGGGAKTINLASTWSGGTLTGAGTVTVAAGDTLDLAGAGTKTLLTTLSVSGTVNYTGTVLTMVGGTILINVGGVWDFESAGDISNGGGTNNFTNNGTVNKNSATASTTMVAVDFDNAGIVNVDLVLVGTNVLDLSAGGSHSGDFAIDASETLRFSGGAHVFAASSDISGGGNLQVTGGTASAIGPFTNTGTTTFSGGSGTISAPAAFATGQVIFSGSQAFTLFDTMNATGVTIAGGTLTVEDVQNWPVLTQTGGTLTGTNTVVLTGASEWSGGTMSGTGVTSVATGQILTISNSVTLSRTLNTTGVSGIISWTGGDITMNDGTIDIAGTAAIFNCDASGIIVNGGGTNLVQLTGDLNKNTAATTTRINVPVNMVLLANADIIVDANTTLQLMAGGSYIGQFTTNGHLEFGGGTHTFADIDTEIFGAGSFSVTAGLVTGIGSFTNLGGAIFSGGTATITSNPDTFTTATMTLSGASVTIFSQITTTGSVTISGGIVTVSDTQFWEGLNFTGGTLQGNGTVNLTGDSTWSGGTMSGLGTTEVDAGVDLVISGAATKTLARTLNNLGLIECIGSNLMFNGGTVTNTALAQFDFNLGADIGDAGGTNLITNTGEMFISNGVGPATSVVDVPLNNNGLVTVNSVVGIITLQLSAGGTHSGDWVVGPLDTLRFSGGSHGFQPTSGISGGGNLQVTGGFATAIGPFTNTGTTTFSGGSGNIAAPAAFACGPVVFTGTADFDVDEVMNATSVSIGPDAHVTVNVAQVWPTLTMTGGTLDGTGDISLTGDSTWTGGTMAGTGDTLVNGNTLLIDDDVTLSREIIVNDSLTWGGGDITFINGTIRVTALTGTFSIGDSVGDQAAINGGGVNLIENRGLMFKAQFNVATIHVRYNSIDGSDVDTDATQGTLRLLGGGTIQGDLRVDAGATMEFGGGTFSFASGANISGSGLTLISAGTVSNIGPLSTTGITRFSGGVSTMNDDGPMTTGPIEVVGDNLTTVTTNQVLNPASVLITGGFLTIDGQDQSWSNFTMSGGVLNVNNGAVLTLNGNNSWTGGLFQDSAGVGTVENVGTLAISGAAPDLRTTLRNLNTINWTAGSIRFLNGTLINELDSDINVTGSGSMISVGGTNVFRNRADLDKHGAGTLTISIPYHHDHPNGDIFAYDTSTVVLNATSTSIGEYHTVGANARILFGGSTTHTLATTSIFEAPLFGDGAYEVLAGSTLTWESGDFFGNGHVDIQVGGALNITTAVAHNSPLTINNTGGVTVAGGTATFTGGGLNTGIMQINAGTLLTIPTAFSFTGGSVNIFGTLNLATNTIGPVVNLHPGGQLTGPGTVTLGSTLNWLGGSITTNFTVNDVSIVNITTAAIKSLRGTFTNNGAVNWAAGDMLIGDGVGAGSFVNANTGTVTITGNNTMTQGAMGGSVTNAGTIQKTAGGAATLIALPYSSTRFTTAASGSLRLTFSVVQQVAGELTAGTWTASNGATLDLPSPISVNSATINIVGVGSSMPDLNNLISNGVAGSITFSSGADFAFTPGGGTLFNSGSLQAGAGSRLTVNGHFQQSATGTFISRISGTIPATNIGNITATGNAAVDGTLTVEFTGGFSPSDGDAFEVVNGSSVIGLFDTVNLPVVPMIDLAAVYSAAAVTITATLRPCPADWNGVDGLDSQDFFDFLADFFDGNADFNGVDGTDSQDYFDFLEAFITGCV